jgi:hypothetical protein
LNVLVEVRFVNNKKNGFDVGFEKFSWCILEEPRNQPRKLQYATNQVVATGGGVFCSYNHTVTTLKTVFFFNMVQCGGKENQGVGSVVTFGGLRTPYPEVNALQPMAGSSLKRTLPVAQ